MTRRGFNLTVKQFCWLDTLARHGPLKTSDINDVSGFTTKGKSWYLYRELANCGLIWRIDQLMPFQLTEAGKIVHAIQVGKNARAAALRLTHARAA